MDKIIIKNGMTYDPLTGKKAVRDIAIADGLISSPVNFKPDYVIDASNCLVTPGLIDFHVHCLTSASDLAINPDIFCLPYGVTSCVDAGSSGVSSFGNAYKRTICDSAVTVKTLLHFCSAGIATSRYPENPTPWLWERDAIKDMVKEYPQIIKGMKLRFQDYILNPFSLDIKVLEEAVSFAGELGLPIVVHVINPGVEIGLCADILRKGDVFCHISAGSRETILDVSGKINPSIIKARERGVIFDVAAGRRNFLFEIARKSLEQGFLPDIISTDMYWGCFNKPPLFNLPWLLSRYMALGLTLYQAIDCVTVNPASWLGYPELATLAEGTPADIAVFRVVERESQFTDFTGASIKGMQILLPQATIKSGVIFFVQTDFYACYNILPE